MVNVGKYTSPMDGMGYFKKLKQKVPQKFFQPVTPARTSGTFQPPSTGKVSRRFWDEVTDARAGL